jgi:L-amino acid N-acyltransferase YncA
MHIAAYTFEWLESITALYKHYVTNSAITFDLDAPSTAQMEQKLEALTRDGYPVLMALDDNQALLGFAYASAYRPKRAYQHSTEITIYVDPSAHGQGIGSALMQALLLKLEADPNFHSAIAMIADDAKASISLHQKFGFKSVGYLGEVGYKFGQWHGVTIMQRKLDNAD